MLEILNFSSSCLKGIFCVRFNLFYLLLELNETVICTNDHMEVVIPSSFFLNKVPPVYVSEL